MIFLVANSNSSFDGGWSLSQSLTHPHYTSHAYSQQEVSRPCSSNNDKIGLLIFRRSSLDDGLSKTRSPVEQRVGLLVNLLY